MLVVGPNSTCDVCLECYTSGDNEPHAITCGHVFCLKCLDHLMQHKCPLCRERFCPLDIRKLHVDRDSEVTKPVESSVAAPPLLDDKSERLLDDIARIVKEGAKLHEIRRVIEQCRTHYKSQPENQYTPVRVSCLLLYNLLEAQRKLAAQTEQLREAAAERDETRDRLTLEVKALQLKYEDLERMSRDERDTALAIEKSLREHYDQMNSFWKGWMESVNQECRSLREQLDRLRSSGTIVPPLPRAIELQYFYKSDPKRSHSNTEDPDLSREETTTTKGKVIDDGKQYDFHLSPLKESAAPLASTVPSLMALADDSDQDEMMKAKQQRPRSPIQEEPELESELEDGGAAAPFPAHLQPPSAKVVPIPIPASRTPPQSSVLAMSITADHWPAGISGSKPRDDVVMTSSSPAPSPSRRHSSGPSRTTTMTTTTAGGVPASRDSAASMTDGSKKQGGRDLNETASKDHHLVSKLHDLLDSPRPTSLLHGHMLQQHASDYPEPGLPRSISRLTSAAPSRPASTGQQPSSSTTTTTVHHHHPEDPHSGVSDRKPLVRASDVAMQLEKERLEKERRRLREVQAVPAGLSHPPPPLHPPFHHPHPHHPLHHPLSASGSLRDATNVAAADGYHLTRSRPIGMGGAVGGGGGGVGGSSGHKPKYHHVSAETVA